MARPPDIPAAPAVEAPSGPAHRPGAFPGAFPRTRGSLVAAAASADEDERRRALGALVEAYWRPVYKYLRRRWKVADADAEDWTQGFFAEVWEKGTLARFDPNVARFRTFLRSCLDAWAQNRRRDAGRAKRGGGQAPLSLDFAGAEEELRLEPADPTADLDALFRRDWVQSLFSLAVDDLEALCRERGRETRFRLFERYDLDPPPDGRPTYAALAAQLEIPLTQVTNELAAARRDLRRALLERLRTTTGSDAEYRVEARDLFGHDPG